MKYTDTANERIVSGIDSVVDSEMDISFEQPLLKPSETSNLLFSPDPSEIYTPLSVPVQLLCKDPLTNSMISSRSKPIRKPAAVDKRKEQKKMRNRVYAQESRDRKRQEFDSLKTEAERLRNENLTLQNELNEAKTEIERLRQLVSSFRGAKPSVNLPRPETPKKVVPEKPKGVKLFRFKCPLFLTTLFLGCLCFAACISTFWARVPILPVFMQPKIAFQEKFTTYSTFYNSPPKEIVSSTGSLLGKTKGSFEDYTEMDGQFGLLRNNWWEEESSILERDNNYWEPFEDRSISSVMDIELISTSNLIEHKT